jgi:FkbM family methyltransferase
VNILRTIAGWFNYDVIRQSKDILLDRHLKNLLEHHNIDCIIDAGANHGQYALSLRNMGYKGEIHSFEPLSGAYATLVSHAEHDADWYTYNFALGSSPAELTINVAENDDFSSFLTPTDYSEETFSNKSRIDHQELVKVKVLDDVLAKTIGDKYIHLKMDTQGYDLEVFKGAQKILDQIKTLQSEISIKQLYEGMPDYITSLSTFRDAGFNITGLFPVTRDKQDLSVIEFDCVMVKT